jgi:hypothetical protein
MNEIRPKIIFILFLTYVFILFFAIYGSPVSMTNNISSTGNSIFSSFFIIISIFIILIFFIFIFGFKNVFEDKINLYYFIIIFIVFFITFLIIFTIYLNSTEYFDNYSPENVNQSQSNNNVSFASIPENKNDINFFPRSTCITNKNTFGYLINNVCVEQNGKNLDDVDNELKIKSDDKTQLKKRIDKIDKRSEDKNFVGICILPDKKFGYKIPILGNDCYTQKQYEKYIKSISEHNVLTKKEKPKEIEVAKENMSKCELDKNTNFDKYCKDYFGDDFGMKEVIKCDNKKYQVQCAENYFNGQLLPSNLSKCYDKNRDFNYICTTKLINENKRNILSGGYKKLYNVCKNKNEYRVECDENYFNGIPIYLNATNCHFQNTNFNQYCKNIYGNNFELDKKISANCKAGFLKGICKKII